jgi:1-aminocyclopropane-1-carboxylate deaminase/D-cysteine desulfhydrase-like pyridoxal-dependent ACC family enzyme
MMDSAVNLEHISLDPLDLQYFRQNQLSVSVLRLDKIHPEISGNKWFKLKYHIESAALLGKKRLISFGGPYSNHIVALAFAAYSRGFSSTGFIRGEKPPVLSPSLFTALKYGMDLRFLTRETYLQKEDPAFLTSLQSAYPEALIIPEGGAGEAGIRGASEILSITETGEFAYVFCAVGTGTMLAGLIDAAAPHQQIAGISVLKGTRGFLPMSPGWVKSKEKLNRVSLIHDYHFGGYAKKTPLLLDFMNEVYDTSGIPTDFVYTGKLFYAVADLARTNYFPRESRILIIHSGGLQGNLSLPPDQLHF